MALHLEPIEKEKETTLHLEPIVPEVSPEKKSIIRQTEAFVSGALKTILPGDLSREFLSDMLTGRVSPVIPFGAPPEMPTAKRLELPAIRTPQQIEESEKTYPKTAVTGRVVGEITTAMSMLPAFRLGAYPVKVAAEKALTRTLTGAMAKQMYPKTINAVLHGVHAAQTFGSYRASRYLYRQALLGKDIDGKSFMKEYGKGFAFGGSLGPVSQIPSVPLRIFSAGGVFGGSAVVDTLVDRGVIRKEDLPEIALWTALGAAFEAIGARSAVRRLKGKEIQTFFRGKARAQAIHNWEDRGWAAKLMKQGWTKDEYINFTYDLMYGKGISVNSRVAVVDVLKVMPSNFVKLPAGQKTQLLDRLMASIKEGKSAPDAMKSATKAMKLPKISSGELNLAVKSAVEIEATRAESDINLVVSDEEIKKMSVDQLEFQRGKIVAAWDNLPDDPELKTEVGNNLIKIEDAITASVGVPKAPMPEVKETKLELIKRYVEQTGEKIDTKADEVKVEKMFPKEWEKATKAEEYKKALWDKLPEDFREMRGINEYTITELEEMAKIEKPVETFTQKLQKIEQEFKTIKAKTKAEIRLVQTEIIEGLEASDLEATDKAKFIRTIKNIQTQQQLIKQLPIIQERIAILETKAQIRKTESQIKKELKRTKPLKVGQRRVGKYDYESNKLFEALRGYNKLTQDKAQAELDAYSDELVSELDLIKKRFLSLKANGATASLEIHNAVLNDILRMKAMGLQAKGEIEFYKLIDRQDRIDEVLTNMGKIKADKKTIKTKIGNVYRRGFSNIYSMMNSIFGKDVAEKYDPEINENDRNTEISIKTRAMTDKAFVIYDEKNVMRKFTEMASKDYIITDFEKLTTEISKLEIIDIYNSIKNEKKAADYYTSYSKGQVLSLINNLTAEDVEFADYLQDTVQEYRKILNQRNIEITGRDLGTVENYWPATSEFQVSVIDDIRIQGETPSAMKERAKGRVIPIPKNAWFKTQRHIAQAEHIANLSREYETLKRLLSDRKVKHEIKNKFGEDVYLTLMDQIENISLNAQIGKIDAVSNLFGKAINNWVTAKIAIPNINVFVRQLMSMGNYVENMKPSEWVSGFAEGIGSPKKTFDYMWNNAPFLKERFNKGYSEAVREAISGAEKINATWGSYTKFLTSLVRTGDITAIIYGGYPLVKAEVAKGKTLKEAIRTFEKATLKAQQSGLASSRSEFQNSRNPFTRLFLAFKNTSNQYFRKMVDAVISYQNKDISVEQFAKTMTIYAVIQPILYVLAGFATVQAIKALGKLLRGDAPEDWEKLGEELADDVITQLAVSPVNAVPILDDIVTFAMRKATGQKIYKVFSTPLFDDMETGIRKLGKKEITAKDWLTIMSSILEPTTALPAKTPIRYYRYLMGNDKESRKRPRL